MFRPVTLLLTSTLLVATFANTANAQYAEGTESDIPPGVDSPASAARLEVKLSEMEERLRKLQGALEQASFENRQLKAQVEKSASDTQFRLNALEAKQASQPTAALVAEPAKEDSSQLRPVEQPAATTETVTSATADPEKFATSRAHYEYAFKLLKQAKYPDSAKSFESFIKTYPKDPLIGNGYYWLGEINYVQRDYIKAASNFGQGYEAMPTGPKASDNLLRLAMSLNAQSKDKEACGVLKQVVIKFANGPGNAKRTAEQEINRIGCN